jgi:NAD-dependent deacetylase
VDEAAELDDLVEEGRRLVAGARHVVALTGAGISTDAGIPDFRGPNGVWTRDPAAERLSNLSVYLEDPSVRRAAWLARLDAPVWSAKPAAGHAALVELERRGLLRTIVTQNVDGLHQAAGSSPSIVVEVHGTTHWTVCWSCGERWPTLTVLQRVRAGEEDPACERCGGILKTATVSFGQSLDPSVLERAQRAALACDVILAIGTTLEVRPVAGIVPLAKVRGAKVVIVNGEPTAGDDLADLVIRGRIGEVLPALARSG